MISKYLSLFKDLSKYSDLAAYIHVSLSRFCYFSHHSIFQYFIEKYPLFRNVFKDQRYTYDLDIYIIHTFSCFKNQTYLTLIKN